MSVALDYSRGTPSSPRRYWPRLALDRASVRSFDSGGRLRVSRANITAARVNEYKGHEIPNFQSHGLSPDRIYRLLRPAEELARPATIVSANNIPILKRHQSITATEYDPDLIIGSTGTDAKFDGTYLTNSLAVWPQTAIDNIESDEARELSAGYAYEFDPSPGVFNGQRYDGVMRNLRLQHVALVPTGRVGPDCVVGDSNPFTRRRKPMARRRYARDQEEGQLDAPEALEQVKRIWMQLADNERDNFLELLREHLGVEAEEEQAGGDPYGEAQDRRRRRMGRDDPPDFPGKPETGGTMVPLQSLPEGERLEALDRISRGRANMAKDAAIDAWLRRSAPPRLALDAAAKGFADRYGNAMRIGLNGMPGPR